ncbi:MAG: hypothetical protein LBS11_10175 [Oscillospiraceae bacterium]|nr:hypothetical protein [Oscillospiraceae bacterium]
MDILTIRANERIGLAPEWALLERQLIHLMDGTPDLVLGKYTNPDGSMKWPPVAEGFESIDALDDMYESFHSWPLYYLLGGSPKFLEYARREYDAITRQFAGYGTGHGHPMVVKEYEQGYDWMHQGEGYLLFYLLNLADPTHAPTRERAIRYAGFLMNEDPEAVNYDYERRMFRCCYLGSMGAAHRNFDGKPWLYADWKQWYGLPFHDLPGVETVDDTRDVEKARRVALAMRDRLAYSDTVINLAATSMVMNAYLHTREEKYKTFIIDYVEAWRERTQRNGGLVPDNVGRNGDIGGEMGGKWYGGYYGWTWPHGFYFIADALMIASENWAALTGDTGIARWLRSQYDLLLSLAVEKDGELYIPMKHADPGAVQQYNQNPTNVLTDDSLPVRNPEHVNLYQKDGWFEFARTPQPQPTHLWFLSRDEDDLDLILRTKRAPKPDWHNRPLDGYSKYMGGQDPRWIEYLRGENPDYPERILTYNINQVYSRLKMIHEDTQDPATYGDAYLQQRNPITCEGLAHLTLGGPMPIYNGGLPQVSLLYYDALEKRPGLPEDVAALVTRLDDDAVYVTIINLNAAESRRMYVQGGAFGEHLIQRVSVDGGADQECGGRWFLLELPPSSRADLRVTLKRYGGQAAYQWPFGG